VKKFPARVGWVALATCNIAFAQQAPIALNMPAQPLDKALNSWASQTGYQILIPADRVAQGRAAPSLNGTYTPEAALKALLSGSHDLDYQFVNDRTVMVRIAQTEAAATSPPPTSGDSKGANQRPLVLAQSSPRENQVAASSEPSSETSAPTAGIQEVVVTAQKRAERLIDVPQSISVLSTDSIAQLGATQLLDFANTVPGLNIATAGAGFTQISMRGVTTGYDVSSTVGIYVDDVPYGSSTTFSLGNLFGLDPALFDLDHVEVLRGPQGTLYGASAMGGLMKYATKLPDPNGFSGSAQGGVSGTRDGGVNYNVASTVNLPIASDKAAVRLSGYETHDGGFIDNVARGKTDINRSDTYGGRVDLLLRPVDELSIRLTGFLQNTSRDGEATADYDTNGAMPYGSLGQSRPFPGGEPFDEKFRLLSATVNYDLGVATATSITGYQTLREGNSWDVSGLFSGLCTAPFETFACSSLAATSTVDLHKFTQEVRLVSKNTRVIEWQIGGFYTHESSSQYEYFALNDTLGQPRANNLFTYYVPSRYTEYAAFGDVTWHIVKEFDITAGIRYARDDQEFSQTGGGLLGTSKPRTSASENVRNYLGTARYHFNDHTTAYIRYATGYRPGGPNYVTLSPTTGLPNGAPTYQPDTLRSYEAGLKAESADRRYTMDLAAYHINWSNIQIATNNGGFSSIANASAGAKLEGAELSLTARPINPLTAGTSFGYTHAYMNKADPTLLSTQGERLPGSPRFTASANVDYQIPWQPAFLPTLGATFRYVSDRTVNFNGNRPPNVQPTLPAYGALDLRSGATVGPANLQLYVHNVTDRRGQLSIILPQFGDRVAILQPRTIGLNVSTRF
jgi:outer membrane receptor protein involved in Fe transport